LVQKYVVEDNYAEVMDNQVMECLQAEINFSDKLDFPRGRLEPQKDKPQMKVYNAALLVISENTDTSGGTYLDNSINSPTSR
jgi:hypothetical protein